MAKCQTNVPSTLETHSILSELNTPSRLGSKTGNICIASDVGVKLEPVSIEDITKNILLQHQALEETARLIYCWNVWIEVLRMDIITFIPEFRTHFESVQWNEVVSNPTKESLLLDLKAFYSLPTRPNSPKHIEELTMELQIWQTFCSEGATILSFIRKSSYEYLINADQECSRSDNMLKLELTKGKIMEIIIEATNNITKCKDKLGPIVLACMKSKEQSNRMQLVLNNAYKVLMLSDDSNLSPTREFIAETWKWPVQNVVLNLQDIPVPLFENRKLPRDVNEGVHFKASADTYIEILQTGTEWYMAWIKFIQAALQEHALNLPPGLRSQLPILHIKIDKQICLLKSLCTIIHKFNESKDNPNEKIQLTSLSALSGLIELLKETEEEAVSVIRYMEACMIDLGSENLNTKPSDEITNNIFLLRNVILFKAAQVSCSVQYLCDEMGFLVEFVKISFYCDENCLSFGEMMSTLRTNDVIYPFKPMQNMVLYSELKYLHLPYTKNFQEIPQEVIRKLRNFENISWNFACFQQRIPSLSASCLTMHSDDSSEFTCQSQDQVSSNVIEHLCEFAQKNIFDTFGCKWDWDDESAGLTILPVDYSMSQISFGDDVFEQATDSEGNIVNDVRELIDKSCSCEF